MLTSKTLNSLLPPERVAFLESTRDMSTDARAALKAAGITTYAQILNITDQQLADVGVDRWDATRMRSGIARWIARKDK